MGRDLYAIVSPRQLIGFQSTRPVWGATRIYLDFMAAYYDFNPRAPCGARRLLQVMLAMAYNFNPRAPCGARPYRSSIFRVLNMDFNPRAPCGARPVLEPGPVIVVQFQSTRPVWGATVSLYV